MATIDADVRAPGAEGDPTPASGPRRFGLRWKLGGLLVGVAVLLGLTIPSALSALHARREMDCRVHLSEIGVALRSYHHVNGHYPAPFTADAAGRPLLSWRVEILPYLGRRDLFDRFRRDEPWDSPTNRALLAEMPDVFRCPESGEATETSYQVVVGPKTDVGSINTPFEPGRGVDRREITDGDSSTILVAEGSGPVPWTRPADLSFRPDLPPPALSKHHQGGPNVILADFSERRLRPTLETPIIRALMTINGGEVWSGGPG